jgi:transketolase
LNLRELEQKCLKIRRDIINQILISQSGHTGSCLSCVELLVALYYHKMRIRPEQPQWIERDRFILSKAHAVPALYAVLADKGYFPREELWTLRKLHSNLQGHPDRKKTPGLETSNGSLGQGLSMAVGMAIGAKLRQKDIQVYALIGDGESQEGQIWEASMAAAHYNLDNLTAIWDHNRLQIDGSNNEVMSLGDLEGKLRAFGYKVISIDGNDISQVIDALDEDTQGMPKAILAETIKGKGVSFMENKVDWHAKAPNSEEAKLALLELEGKNVK